MARKKKDGYMPKSEVLLILQNYIRTIQMNDYGTDSGIPQLYKTMTYIEDAPTVDVVETKRISEILAVLFENNIVEKYIPNTANAGSWEDFLRKACSGEYGMLR